MAELSPQAQAVYDAFSREARPEPHHQREALAAALRAAVEQVLPFEDLNRFPDSGDVLLVLASQRQMDRLDLLAIAHELEQHQ